MDDKYINNALEQMFRQAQRQFGDAIKYHWFNDGEVCPGCGSNLDFIKVKGGNAMSLNAFIYRKRRVLIGYLLCSRCAKKIFGAAKLNPYKQIPLHDDIETNLAKAYEGYMRSLDA